MIILKYRILKRQNEDMKTRITGFTALLVLPEGIKSGK